MAVYLLCMNIRENRSRRVNWERWTMHGDAPSSRPF